MDTIRSGWIPGRGIKLPTLGGRNAAPEVFKHSWGTGFHWRLHGRDVLATAALRRMPQTDQTSLRGRLKRRHDQASTTTHVLVQALATTLGLRSPGYEHQPVRLVSRATLAGPSKPRLVLRHLRSTRLPASSISNPLSLIWRYPRD